MVETHKPSNIKLETALLFKNRKVEFIKMETLHLIDFYDVELNKKVPVQIVSQQHSINSEIKIFLDTFVLKNSLPENTDDIIEFMGLCDINSKNNASAGFAYGKNIFFNTKKTENLESFLIHELQHSFDYYVGIIPPIMEAHNESEYRAILAEIVFGKPEDVMNTYDKIKYASILSETYIEESLANLKKCVFNKKEYPHSWANMKILRELNYMDFKNPLRLDIIDSLSNEEIIERSKILLNNEYRRLTGKSYDELLDDLIEKAKKGEY